MRRWGLLVVGVLGVWLAVWGYVLRGLPPIDDAQLAVPSTQILDRHGRLLYEITPAGSGGRQNSLPLDAIPQHCVNALVATEDANFYRHPGVDPIGVMRALWLNLRGGEVVAGGSTITQQVARNLLLDPQARAERTLRRKLREMALALRLQSRYSKDEVLALWLNQTSFGNMAFGVDAAARAYFGKSASQLSLPECALLLGIPQSPAAYNPLTNLEAAKTRQATVLRLMTENDMISQAEADRAAQDSLQFAAVPYPIEAPHAVMAVWDELAQSYPTHEQGLIVTTTIDLDWQRTTQRIVREQLAILNDPPMRDRPAANANNAAVVALDPHTGAVRVMLGSPDYFDQQTSGAVNGALQPRQPGSTLKPFTYALSMDPERVNPWTAATVVMDVRTPFITQRLESYVPANFGFVEHGPVRVREALASSYNIPAVIALETVGVTPFVEFMATLGVETLSEIPEVDLSVTLGGGEVRLLDLSAAYGALANGGHRVQPYLIERVVSADGVTLFEQTVRPGSGVIDSRVAYLVTDMLVDDEARRPGFGANSLLQVGRPAAVKTGTTTDFRDNWVMGYTPNLVVGVWVGNMDYTPMVNATGLTGAGPIWHHVIRTLLRGQPEVSFERPDGLEQVEICSLSGMLPTVACANTRDEWFIAGTAPTETDTFYRTFVIDRETGLLADETTPPHRQQEQVYVVLPPEARAWAARNGIQPPPVAMTALVAVDQIRLLSPDPYTIFEVSEILPPETQRVRLEVAAPVGVREVTYLLNGIPVGTATQDPWTVWWQLAVGDYTLFAEGVLEDGTIQRSDPLVFTVVENEPRQSFDVPPGP